MERVAGRWTVRVLERNFAALAFWRNAVRRYTRDVFTERALEAPPGHWRVLELASDRGG